MPSAMAFRCLLPPPAPNPLMPTCGGGALSVGFWKTLGLSHPRKYLPGQGHLARLQISQVMWKLALTRVFRLALMGSNWMGLA